ncbi:MAG: hypothetical protein QOE14_688 [Humisphaera sp.]|nr:hypothetical protein [Humisphaera sp.]
MRSQRHRVSGQVVSPGSRFAPAARQRARGQAALAQATRPCMEALDDRTLLAVSFEFTISDPTNKYKSIRPQLQAILNAAGHEWSTHLNGTAKLQYNVAFSETLPQNDPLALATGAAKSAEIIRTDPFGVATYQLGTALEIKDGVDRNGSKADAGITIYGPHIGSWFFETDTNARDAVIPEGLYDGYTVILHELAHTLGFASTRNAFGTVASIGQYTYDEHVNVFGPGAYSFGEFTDNAYAVYGSSVSLQIGNPNHLGNGRFVDPGFRDQFLTFFTFFNNFFTDDLSTDLMSGQFQTGERRTISRLDLAMLKDAETPVNLTVDSTPQGLFTIDGTGLSDVINVSLSNGTLLVRVNNSVQSFPADINRDITAIVINGLNGNDTITLSSNMPSVAINGGAGADSLFGGPRSDSIYGGGGHDLIVGGGGGDVIRGGDGNDTILGQGGSDRLFGDAGSDHVDGGVQTDRINGGANGDTLVGGTENDFLFGDSGNDVLSGAGGKDRMNGGTGSDQFYGGAGNDAVDYSQSLGPVTVTVDGSPDDGVVGENDNVIDGENIIGSSFDDVLIGSEGGDGLIGGAGNDTLLGGGGHDTIEGNNGLDVLDGGGGHDILIGGDGNDHLTGGTGLDSLTGGLGDDAFVTNDGEVDTIHGDDGVDTVTGDEDDQLFDVEIADLAPAPSKPERAVAPASRRVTFQ